MTVSLKSLCKRFGDGTEAVRGIDMRRIELDALPH